MKKNIFVCKTHSMVQLITNSSTELFTGKAIEKVELKYLISTIYKTEHKTIF